MQEAEDNTKVERLKVDELEGDSLLPVPPTEVAVTAEDSPSSDAAAIPVVLPCVEDPDGGSDDDGLLASTVPSPVTSPLPHTAPADDELSSSTSEYEVLDMIDMFLALPPYAGGEEK